MRTVASFAAPKPISRTSSTYAERFGIGSADSHNVKANAAAIDTAHCRTSMRVTTGRA